MCLPCFLLAAWIKLFCWFWRLLKKNDNKRELLKEVLREAYDEENCIQLLLINLILLPFFLFLFCIKLFWWLFTKGEEFLSCAVCRCQLLLPEAGESGKVAPTAVDAVPTRPKNQPLPRRPKNKPLLPRPKNKPPQPPWAPWLLSTRASPWSPTRPCSPSSSNPDKNYPLSDSGPESQPRCIQRKMRSQLFIPKNMRRRWRRPRPRSQRRRRRRRRPSPPQRRRSGLSEKDCRGAPRAEPRDGRRKRRK